MANRLASEASLYLRQHAENPVDWLPWGGEALRRARDEDKPLLASIGYSSCHWCHVMAAESFEDAETAAVMNERFVCVKVDREERPDVDTVCMDYCQAVTGQGGWPLTIFMTPDLKPFFVGTYFPSLDQHGRPGFRRLVRELGDAYRTKRRQIEVASAEIASRVKPWLEPVGERHALDRDLLDSAAAGIGERFDWDNGGLQGAPKFPQPVILEYLLRYHVLTGDDNARAMVETTLLKMARGGIFDHVGGGFHRYCVDALWQIPHFEKMLYDNAQLLRVYLHAYQVTANDSLRDIAERTAEFLLRDMLLPDGAFGAALDADVGHVEGGHYVWTQDELSYALGPENARLAGGWYGVTEEGNFADGATVLAEHNERDEFAAGVGISGAELDRKLAEIRGLVLTYRQTRPRPARDDKAVASWNGLALAALAEASVVLDRPDLLSVATRLGDFLVDAMKREGVLHRSWSDGRLSAPGFLEDYALVADGLVALHQATLDERWLDESALLTRDLVALFWDARTGRFSDASAAHGPLPHAPRNVTDSAMPCGSSAATTVLLKLASVEGRHDYQDIAVEALSKVSALAASYPVGFGNWLCALDFQLKHYKQVVVHGGSQVPGAADVLREVQRPYVPNRILVGHEHQSKSKKKG